MKRMRLVLPILCGAPLLQSCASTPVETQAWRVEPLQRVRHSTERPEAYYQLGRYYLGQKRNDQAIQAFRKALAGDGRLAEARNALATIYAAQGKYDLAIEEFQTVIAQSPGSAHAHNNLGYAHYLQGHYSEAIAAFETAIRLEPKNQRALNNLGLAYAKAGQPERSHEAFVQAAVTAAPGQSHERAPDPRASQAAVPQEKVLALPKDRGVIITTEVKAAATPLHDAADRGTGAPIFTVAGPADAAAPAAQVVQVDETRTGTAWSAPSALAAGEQILSVHTAAQTRMEISQSSPYVYELRAREEPAPVAAAVASALRQTVQARGTATLQWNFRLEVSNGNGINGLAKRVGVALGEYGLSKVRLTNQKPFGQPVTRVEYREGFAEQANLLSARFSQGPVTVKTARLDPRADVRIVLGRDQPWNFALVEPKTDGYPVALSSLPVGR